jgi:glutathione synthase/RimK-type ligase-like ATP-grasp enzyme
MPSVLLATCADLPDGDEDAPLLSAALDRVGVDARWVAWTDPQVDWDESLVVIRSTWDYPTDHDRFIEWTARVPQLANDAAVIAWNTDKVYLHDLLEAGVPVVPTSVVRPGAAIEPPDSDEFVVKPSVGAGSRGVGRFGRAQVAAADEHAAALHAAGRTVLVQPYLAAVDSAGETALIFIDGQFSHAIRKGAMLSGDTAHAVTGDDLYIQEQISARTPSEAELAVAELALAAIRARFGRDQLFVRVDLLPAVDGPVVVELELVEPSLFLHYGPAPADRLATAIAARL